MNMSISCYSILYYIFERFSKAQKYLHNYDYVRILSINTVIYKSTLHQVRIRNNWSTKYKVCEWVTRFRLIFLIDKRSCDNGQKTSGPRFTNSVQRLWFVFTLYGYHVRIPGRGSHHGVQNLVHTRSCTLKKKTIWLERDVTTRWKPYTSDGRKNDRRCLGVRHFVRLAVHGSPIWITGRCALITLVSSMITFRRPLHITADSGINEPVVSHIWLPLNHCRS